MNNLKLLHCFVCCTLNFEMNFIMFISFFCFIFMFHFVSVLLYSVSVLFNHMWTARNENKHTYYMPALQPARPPVGLHFWYIWGWIFVYMLRKTFLCSASSSFLNIYFESFSSFQCNESELEFIWMGISFFHIHKKKCFIFMLCQLLEKKFCYT